MSASRQATAHSVASLYCPNTYREVIMHALHTRPCPAKARCKSRNIFLQTLIPPWSRYSRGSACFVAAAGSSAPQDTVDVAVIGSGIIGKMHMAVSHPSYCHYFLGRCSDLRPASTRVSAAAASRAKLLAPCQQELKQAQRVCELFGACRTVCGSEAAAGH
jgi:hypothetical protein